eukprot:20489_1
MTASLRFEGELNVDLNEFVTNLVRFRDYIIGTCVYREDIQRMAVITLLEVKQFRERINGNTSIIATWVWLNNHGIRGLLVYAQSLFDEDKEEEANERIIQTKQEIFDQMAR